MEIFVTILKYFVFGSLSFIGLCAIIIPICLFFENRFISFKRFYRAARSWNRYKITRSEHLFGFHWWDKGYQYDYQPLARDERHAMKRYFRWYRKTYKQRAKGDLKNLHETTSEWGVYKVENLKTGEKTFFN